MLEFFDPSNNKGNGLKEYAKESGILLLETEDLGVCFLNGCQEAKEIVDEVTEYDASHDGVGR